MPNHFDNETPWYGAVSNRQFPDAINLGLNQLNYVRINQPTKYRTPKGTPFYFMGIAAFASPQKINVVATREQGFAEGSAAGGKRSRMGSHRRNWMQ